jgi:hypothetical protein
MDAETTARALVREAARTAVDKGLEGLEARLTEALLAAVRAGRESAAYGYLVRANGPRHQYWAGQGIRDWTIDAGVAVWFMRQEDAENVCEWLRRHHRDLCVVLRGREMAS